MEINNSDSEYKINRNAQADKIFEFLFGKSIAKECPHCGSTNTEAIDEPLICRDDTNTIISFAQTRKCFDCKNKYKSYFNAVCVQNRKLNKEESK